MSDNIKSCVAELIGVFILVFVGAASIIMDVGLVGIAIAHGLALSIAVTATMNVSGGHINPAITLGLLTIKKVELKTALMYIGSQLIGAVLAGLLLKALFPAEGAAATALGTPTVAAGLDSGKAIALEIIGTFLLATAVYGTAAGSRAPKGIGGFGVGLTLAMVILAIGPLTGSALNPARHFGTALFGGQLGASVVYWVGPIVGAIMAFLICSKVLEPEKTD